MTQLQFIFLHSRPIWIPIFFLLTSNADLLQESAFDEEFVSCKHFIDKTLLLEKFFKNNDTREFITAPSGFGKTSNLKMIEKFSQVEFDSKGNTLAGNQTTAKLFKSLQIGQDEATMEHLGQHPVIFFDMAFDIEGEITNDKIYAAYSFQLNKTYSRYHGFLSSHFVDGTKILPPELDLMNRLKKGVIREPDIKEGILLLAKMLNLHCNNSIVLLVDNFDYIVHKSLIDYKGYVEPVYSLFEEIVFKCFRYNPELIKYIMIASVTSVGFHYFGFHNYFKHSFFYDNHLYSDYFGLTKADIGDKYNEEELAESAAIIEKYCGGYEIKEKNQTVYNTSCVIDYFQTTDKASWMDQQKPSQPSKFLWKLFKMPEYLEQASRLIKLYPIRHGRNDFISLNNLTELIANDFNETKFTSGINSTAFSYMIQTGLLTTIQTRSASVLPNLRVRNQFITDLFYYFEKVVNIDLKLIGSQLGDFFNMEKNYTTPRSNLMETLTTVFGKLKPIYVPMKNRSTQMKVSADFTYQAILHLSALTNKQIQLIEDYPQPVRRDKSNINEIIRAVTLIQKNNVSLLIKASDQHNLRSLISQKGKYLDLEKDPCINLVIYLAIRVEPDSRVMIDLMTSEFVDEISQNTTYHYITSQPKITKPPKPKQNKTRKYFNKTGGFFKRTTVSLGGFEYD